MIVSQTEVNIRKQFLNDEDVKLYEFYKERLQINKMNFNIPLNQRVTINQIIELKLQDVDFCDHRSISMYKHLKSILNDHFGKDVYLNHLTYDDWLNAAKEIYKKPVYRGQQNSENAKRIMAPKTLRRHFANMSSAISFAQSKGINIENHPLKVIQTFIRPNLENGSSNE